MEEFHYTLATLTTLNHFEAQNISKWPKYGGFSQMIECLHKYKYILLWYFIKETSWELTHIQEFFIDNSLHLFKGNNGLILKSFIVATYIKKAVFNQNLIWKQMCFFYILLLYIASMW